MTTVSRCYKQTGQQKDRCHDPATVVRTTKSRRGWVQGTKLSDVENKRRDEAKARKWYQLAKNMTGNGICSNPRDPKGSGPQMVIHG